MPIKPSDTVPATIAQHCRRIRRAMLHTGEGPVHASLRDYSSPLPRTALPEVIATINAMAKEVRASYAQPASDHRRSKRRKKVGK